MKNSTFGALASLAICAGCSSEIGDPAANGPNAFPSDGAPAVGTNPDGSPVVGPTPNGSSGNPAVPPQAPVEYSARPLVLDGEPIHTRFLRLTNEQWERAVQDVLNLDAPPGKSTFFETPVVGATDFINNEAVLYVSNNQWEQYELAAEAVAKEVGATDQAMQRVYAGTDAEGFIREVGQRAYRRPLTDAEVAALQEVFEQGAALSGEQSEFTKGAALVVEALLQNPHFLYRTELGEEGQPLDSFEIAAKLSLWLRGTSPDEQLLARAARGELNTEAAVASAAAEMLEEAPARDVLRTFHAELFEFQRFKDVSKIVPEYDPAMNAEIEAASVAFFEHIFSSGLGLREILTSTQGYVGPYTAELYGITAAPSQLELRDLGPERAGYFSQVPYLMVFGNGSQSDAIHRGVHLNFEVLCAELDPPQIANLTLIAAQPDQTSRERVEVSTASCGVGCHDAYINPLGFAFENFDGLGRLRTEDSGKPVDTSSAYPFTGGTRAFSGAPELMSIMADNDMAHRCYAKHLVEFSLQRDLSAADEGLIDELAQLSLNEASIKDMIVELVKKPAFRVRGGGL